MQHAQRMKIVHARCNVYQTPCDGVLHHEHMNTSRGWLSHDIIGYCHICLQASAIRVSPLRIKCCYLH